MAFNFAGRAFNFDLDGDVATNLTKLTEGANKTLKLGGDSCNIMGTIGAITPDIKTAITAAETEVKTAEMLTKTQDAAGQLTEAMSSIIASKETATSKIDQVNALLTKLTDAGKTEMKSKLEQAFIDYMDAVDGKATKVNASAGTGIQIPVPVMDADGHPTYDAFGDPITELKSPGDAIADAMTKAEEKLNVCVEKLGDMVSVTGGLSCKGIQEAMLNSKFEASGTVGEATKEVKSKVPRHTRRIQDNGALVNFNIDRKKPFRDVTETLQVRNLSANEEAGESPFEEKTTLIRVYGTEAQLNKRYGAKVEEIPEEEVEQIAL